MNFNNILFLDIETVSQYETYEQLPEDWKELWGLKADIINRGKTEESSESVYHRAGIYAELENANSAVRILHADTLKFIVRVNAGVDPRIYFELMALSIRKDKREIKVTEVSAWKNTKQSVYEKIPFTISKVQDGVYILLLPHLATGEYLFSTDKGSYAFGID